MLTDLRVTRFLSASIFLVVLIGIFLGAIPFLFNPGEKFVYVLGGVLFIIGSFPFFKGFRTKELDPFNPIYLFVFYFIFLMGVRGFYDLEFADYLRLPISDLNVVMSQVFLYSSLALIFLYIGYYSKIGIKAINFLPKILSSNWVKGKVIFTVITCLVIGVSAGLLLLTQVGGIWNILENPSWFAFRGTEGKFYLVPLLAFSIVGFYVLYLYRVEVKKRNLFEKIVLFTYGILLLGFYAILGTKFTILYIVVTLLMFHHYFIRPVSFKKIFILLIIFIPLLLVLSYSYGASGGNLSIVKDYLNSLKDPFNFYSMIIGRAYGAESFALILDQTPRLYDFQYGHTMKSLLYWYIPRGWWPEKPLSAGLSFGETYLSHSPLAGNAFMAPSLVGDLYLNFHIFGIIIGFLSLGVILRTAYTYFVKINRNKVSLLLYAPFFLCVIHGTEGPVATQIQLFLAWFFPAIIVALFLSRSNPNLKR